MTNREDIPAVEGLARDQGTNLGAVTVSGSSVDSSAIFIRREKICNLKAQWAATQLIPTGPTE